MLGSWSRVGLFAAGAAGGARVWDALRVGWPAAAPADNLRSPLYWLAAAVGGVLAVFLLPALFRIVSRLIHSWTSRLQRAPVQDIAAGAVGLIGGLVISRLISDFIPRGLSGLGDLLPLAITAAVTYTAVVVSVGKRDDLAALLRGQGADGGNARLGETGVPRGPTILDTSVIIDGRVADIARTNFLEGPLVVPEFVLRELQHIADSPDMLRRNRGRRGLDILKLMQKEARVDIQVVDWDTDDAADVDTKLVRLAKAVGGKVMTNDYNLNKVAQLHGVQVLNINELANALKPAVLPGEEMNVHVIRDGKEHGQGVAYLDDGTMIVVEGGRRYIGSEIDVTVTSVLQTAAGRMIFARPNNNDSPAVVSGGRIRAARETG